MRRRFPSLGREKTRHTCLCPRVFYETLQMLLVSWQEAAAATESHWCGRGRYISGASKQAHVRTTSATSRRQPSSCSLPNQAPMGNDQVAPPTTDQSPPRHFHTTTSFPTQIATEPLLLGCGREYSNGAAKLLLVVKTTAKRGFGCDQNEAVDGSYLHKEARGGGDGRSLTWMGVSTCAPFRGASGRGPIEMHRMEFVKTKHWLATGCLQAKSGFFLSCLRHHGGQRCADLAHEIAVVRVGIREMAPFLHFSCPRPNNCLHVSKPQATHEWSPRLTRPFGQVGVR